MSSHRRSFTAAARRAISSKVRSFFGEKLDEAVLAAKVASVRDVQDQVIEPLRRHVLREGQAHKAGIVAWRPVAIP